MTLFSSPNGILPHDVDHRRRLSDIKTQLQGLMRQKVRPNSSVFLFRFGYSRKSMMKKN